MRQSKLAVSALLLVVFGSCSDSRKESDTKPITVPTVTIQKKDLKLDHVYVSDIQAIRNVELRSKVAGFLESIHVDEGETVKRGQVLFKISDNEYKNEVARARAMLNIADADKKTAEVELERIRVLVDKKIVSQTEQELALSKLKAAKSRIEEAASNLDMALHKLSYTIIRAPFDGVVDRMPLKAGSLIGEGTLMTSVSDISAMYVYFNISENEYLSYKRALNTGLGGENNTVCLVLSDGKEYDCKGTVETIVSEFDESTGSIAFRAKFPNPDQLLKHNATGKVKLTTTLDDALIIPQKAVFEIQDKNYVFVVDKKNTVRMKNFHPGGRSNLYYIIKSGLDEGEVVVYEGIQNLKDGMTITPQGHTDDTPRQISAL